MTGRRRFVEPCRVCNGAPLHRLGCPVLNRWTLAATLIFGGLLVLSVLRALFDQPVGRLPQLASATLVFGLYWLASRRRSLDRDGEP